VVTRIERGELTWRVIVLPAPPADQQPAATRTTRDDDDDEERYDEDPLGRVTR
jgi:hypothetical protein